MPEIDLVLPVYNPGKGWAQITVLKKKELEEVLGGKVNLIVSDDGSPDTSELDELQRIHLDVEVVRSSHNQGKGSALRAGFERAQGEMVVFTDADFPYDMLSMKRMVDELRNGADVALGYREEDYYASVPWFRKGLSEAFRFVLKSILSFPITDTQCGLKGMNQRGRDIFLKTKINRFLVDMEFIKRATRQPDLDIKPVIVQLRTDVTFSSMGPGVLLREFANFVRVLFL